MAAHAPIKPFSKEETRKILTHLEQPAVFVDMTCDWPALHWTAQQLSVCLGDKLVRFRLGRKENMKTPLFETQCPYVEATLKQFLCWTQGQTGASVGRLSEYSLSEYWAYADYKYIALLFQDQPNMFEDVKWSDFGFEGRDGRNSTLWIGTEGANTPCHQDTYGCNLVLQVQGRKRWHLFPPHDTSKIYPTRIPYEESSVFSQVDVLHPDLKRFPAFQNARRHVVTLQPGQVLYVPRHWWHYVESLDPITVSINSWIEMDVDDVARVSEAVTKAVVCAMKSCQSDDNRDDWLNPTEEGVTSHNENMQYLNLAITACAQKQMQLSPSKVIPDPRDRGAAKCDSSGDTKKRTNSVRDGAAFSLPFGPHLISVCCQQVSTTDTRQASPEGPEIRSLEQRLVQRSECSSTVSGRQQGQPECRSGLDQRGACRLPERMSVESSEDMRGSVITTNDLLDCLLHPDIIRRVTELLLTRHTGDQRDTAAS